MKCRVWGVKKVRSRNRKLNYHGGVGALTPYWGEALPLGPTALRAEVRGLMKIAITEHLSWAWDFTDVASFFSLMCSEVGRHYSLYFTEKKMRLKELR